MFQSYWVAWMVDEVYCDRRRSDDITPPQLSTAATWSSGVQERVLLVRFVVACIIGCFTLLRLDLLDLFDVPDSDEAAV